MIYLAKIYFYTLKKKYEERMQQLEEEKKSLEIMLDESKKSLFQSESSEKEIEQKCIELEQNIVKLNADFEHQKQEIEKLRSLLNESQTKRELAEKNQHLSQIQLLQKAFCLLIFRSQKRFTISNYISCFFFVSGSLKL